MSTPISEELLSAYLDGELTPAEREEIERQLEVSPRLRARLEELAEVCQSVRALPCPKAPCEVQAFVLQRIQSLACPAVQKISAAGRRQLWLYWSGLAAACLAVAVALWQLPPRLWPHQEVRLTANDPSGMGGGAGEKTALGKSVESFPFATPGLQLNVQQELALRIEPKAPAVQVINVSKDEIRRKLLELDHPPAVGNSFKVPANARSEEGEMPVVVVMTVVDTMQAMNQMQVLLRQQQVRSFGGDGVLMQRKANSAAPLVAVELDLPGEEIAQLLHDIPAIDAVIYVADGSNDKQALAAADRDGLDRAPARSLGDAKPMAAAESNAAAPLADKGVPLSQNFDFAPLYAPVPEGGAGVKGDAPLLAGRATAPLERGLKDAAALAEKEHNAPSPAAKPALAASPPAPAAPQEGEQLAQREMQRRGDSAEGLGVSPGPKVKATVLFKPQFRQAKEPMK